MGIKSLEKSLESLDAKIGALRVQSAAIDRWRGDAAAALFHLRPKRDGPMIVAILGGTGTGKSTLVNRILEANLSAASFRRTFTAGPVAIAKIASEVPQNWLGLPHAPVPPADLPARGRADSLLIVETKHDVLNRVVLVDTPDLDGDQPVHHAQADRAFRWAEGIIFLVSPEKYQMTELLPYYRLARRYALPAIFVMNKCETAEMLEDYRQLVSADDAEATVYTIARDDAAYEPPLQGNLQSLRQAISTMQSADDSARRSGVAVRVTDLLGRLHDQITGPLRAQRRDADAAVSALRAMETPPPGVDVNPITEQLQRRLQQRSVLYLIGPGRVLDRVRQVPGILVRLPRTAWELVMHGKTELKSALGTEGNSAAPQVPDFNAALTDQFAIIQSRIDDCLRSVPSGPKWLGDGGAGYAGSKLDPADAGKIADEELKELNDWLQKRWDATPRDTVLLLKLLRHLPGGEKLTQWTEAAPYLLAIIVAAHHAIFGHIDLMILGGYSVATWLTERLSNEVASRTRRANRAIADRFEKLVHEQIRRSIAWIESRAPRLAELNVIDAMAEELEEQATTRDK
ncbi:MAG: GTPase [Tepidisphaeraceae bacterium]|jgi:50S ribosome-binding GTPase